MGRLVEAAKYSNESYLLHLANLAENGNAEAISTLKEAGFNLDYKQVTQNIRDYDPEGRISTALIKEIQGQKGAYQRALELELSISINNAMFSYDYSKIKKLEGDISKRIINARRILRGAEPL